MHDKDIITALVAFLAAAITLLGSLVVRSNVVSGFRQAWIDGQRVDLATVCAKAVAVSSNRSVDPLAAMEEFAAAFSRIRLRENPRKPEWAIIIDQIELLYRDLWEKLGQQHDVTATIRSIEDDARKPLKTNWNRTRNGERIYLLGAVATALFILGVLLMIVLYALHPASGTEPIAGTRTIVVEEHGPTLVRSAGRPSTSHTRTASDHARSPAIR